ncbi:MAG: metal-dependent hydrolase [Planctomycetales bacterium 4484_113]|nr:MAG: metal-dependent hydrolase [Planctomycetales bacterium 4484_113]
MADNSFVWCGHSALKVVTGEGTVLYVDPFLSENPSCPPQLKTPEACDVIAVTHGHSDHLGDTVKIYEQFRPKIVAIFELAQMLQEQGVAAEDLVGMNIGGTAEAKGLKFSMVPATHSSAAVDGGKLRYSGDPAGFVVTLEDGFRFYHAGDTWITADMEFIGKLFAPEVGFLPIGGFYTMDPRAAAMAARLVGLKKVIPIHYGTMPVLSGEVAELEEELKGSGIVVQAPPAGQVFSLP